MASIPTPSSSSAASTIFKPGVAVEIGIDGDGFCPSWFTGKIVCCLDDDKFTIKYDDIMLHERGKTQLREIVKLCQLRPIPPKEIIQDFKLGDTVDAYRNYGWWEGRICRLLADGRRVVYFDDLEMKLEFPEEELRLHRDWIDGSWVPPFPPNDSEIKEMVRVKASEIVTGDKVDFKFKTGTLVEVCSEEEGLRGAWFCATLIEAKADWKFVVEYESLLDDEDGSKLLREEISMLQIRPRPPRTDEVVQFKFLDEVDTYYHDGWWVGIVFEVLGDSKYKVYFRGSDEEMVFHHSRLRPHQDWVDFKWVMPSKTFKF